MPQQLSNKKDRANKILEMLSNARDDSLKKGVDGGKGVGYHLEQLYPSDLKSQGSHIKEMKRQRLNLTRHTVLAILEANNVSVTVDDQNEFLISSQMKKPPSDTHSALSIPKFLMAHLNADQPQNLQFNKKEVKSLLKAAEGIMMRRQVRVGQPLYEDNFEGRKCDTVVERVKLERGEVQTATEDSPIVMDSSLLKSTQAQGRPPRNLRSCNVTSTLGKNQYLISSYLVKGTHLEGLQAVAEKKAEHMNKFLGLKDDKKLPARVNYSSVLDGKDHPLSRVLNQFKGDNELTLQKKAGNEGQPIIVRMNTTQKDFAFQTGSARVDNIIKNVSDSIIKPAAALGITGTLVTGLGMGVGLIAGAVSLAAVVGVGAGLMAGTLAFAATGIGAIVLGVIGGLTLGVLALRSAMASTKVNPEIYQRLDSVISGLDQAMQSEKEVEITHFNKAFGAQATTNDVNQLMASKKTELQYLKAQLKAVEAGDLKPGNRWKPVLEQMITVRTGAVGLMGCKSGKDRAFGITALTMAMEKRMADCIEGVDLKQEKLNQLDVRTDLQLANYLKEIYMSDYGPRVGADNCDGAYGTKDPEQFFPPKLMKALEDQSELKVKMKASHQLAKLNGGIKEFDPDLSQPIVQGVVQESPLHSNSFRDQGAELKGGFKEFPPSFSQPIVEVTAQRNPLHSDNEGAPDYPNPTRREGP